MNESRAVTPDNAPDAEIRLTVRLPRELRDWLLQTGKAEHRKLNQQIVHLLEQSRSQSMTPSP